MLILTRKIDQSFEISTSDGEVVATITVLGVERDRVKVGIDAPKSVQVLRSELVHKPPMFPATLEHK